MNYIFKKGSKERVIILLHGTGSNEVDFIPIATRIDSKASVLSIRGDVQENGMNRYFRRYGVGHYDIENYNSESIKLINTIKELSVKYDLNLDNAIIVGFSNGANIAQGILQNDPKLINRYVLLSPDYINIEEGFNDLDKTKVFISTADNDPYVNPINIVLLKKRLTKANASVTIHKGNGHQISFDDLEAVTKWLNK